MENTCNAMHDAQASICCVRPKPGAGGCDDAPPLSSPSLSLCSLPLRIAFTYSLSLSTLYLLSPPISLSHL